MIDIVMRIMQAAINDGNLCSMQETHVQLDSTDSLSSSNPLIYSPTPAPTLKILQIPRVAKLRYNIN